VKWIQQQDFYDNTTIVISGDHLTMDSGYIQAMGADNFDRKTYVTIINPAQDCTASAEGREYTTMDLYPTTLASLGVEIEGNRLGLGVNLFSEVPTLYEEYGKEYLEEELLKNSDLYTKKLLY
jgi:phosphoglycerol transferase